MRSRERALAGKPLAPTAMREEAPCLSLANLSLLLAERLAMNSSEAPSPSLAPLPARNGDHVAIHQLLLQVFRGPSQHDFNAQLEEPNYLPSRRLVARDGTQLVGHVRYVPGRMHGGAGELATARVNDLAVMGEYRRRGVGSSLLAAAEQAALKEGIALLIARSDRQTLFQRQGWFPAGRSCFSIAGPREILAELDRRRYLRPGSQLPLFKRPPHHEISVRRWRQTEHAAIERLYRDSFRGVTGPLERTEEQWRWLINRAAFDWFYVAVEGGDRATTHDQSPHIVGYMFMKQNRIVELATDTDHDEAARALLMRACRDIMEQNEFPVRLEAPPTSPLHGLCVASGGTTQHTEREQGFVRWMKVLDWPRFIEANLPSGIVDEPLIVEIADRADAPRYLRIDASGVRWQTAVHEPCALRATQAGLAQFFLADQTTVRLIDQRLIVPTQAAHDPAWEAIPRGRAYWMPLLEDLLG